MKKIMTVLFAPLLILSTNVFANKITITGEPIALEKRGDIYYTPGSFRPTGDYYFVNVEGTKRICYAEKRPELARLDVMPLSVNVGGTTHSWVCYSYDPEFFVIQ